MITDYGYVGLFLIFGVIFVGGAFIVSSLLRPSDPNRIKNSPYECGEAVKGTSWGQFNIRYYLVAITAVIFDVAALFLVSLAISISRLGVLAYVEMLFFIAVLIIGLIFVWKKGAFEWQ